MIFWRGWGILVFIITFVWIFILIGIMIAAEFYEPDAVKAAVYTDRLFSLSFILSAISVLFLSRYRDRKPYEVVDPSTGKIDLVPHTDEFMFIPMKYWTYIIAAISVGIFIKSFFE